MTHPSLSVPTSLRRAGARAALALAALISTGAATHAADLSNQYLWKPVKMGGATYFTNLWLHPTERDLVYVHSDTSVAARWQPESASWTYISTAKSMPRPPGGYLPSYPGAASIAGAPSDPDVVYQAVNDKLTGGSSGNIYRSDNRGDSWTLPGAPLNIAVLPNAEGRDAGPRLAVDPVNADVVYYGSQRAGLWLTTDGAVTWTQVSALPAPTTGGGVRVVAFDSSAGSAGGRSLRVLAAVQASGIWESLDGGATWTNTGGITSDVHSMKIASDGVVYAVRYGGEVRRYQAGAWTTINPVGVTSSRAIAVDPQNPARLFLMRGFSATGAYISTDRGDTWTQVTRSFGDILPWHQLFYASGGSSTQVGDVQFDPFDSNKVWLAEAYGLWQGLLAGSTVSWNTVSDGTEGTASQAIIKPPGGAVITANMDLGLFYHEDPDAYTSVQLTSPQGNNYTNGWGVAYSAGQPSFVAGVSAPGNSFTREESGYSFSGGAPGTWVTFPTLPPYNTTTPTGIAVSATDTTNIVMFSGSRNAVYATKDRGVTWSSQVFGSTFNAFYGPGQGALAADRVTGGTFYVYEWANNGRFWRSTDGGGTWSITSTSLPAGSFPTLQSTPGRAGHLWFAPGGRIGGVDEPLYRSTDGGDTWTTISGTTFARSVALGAAAPGAAYPTLYLYGRVNGDEGVFRSVDEGASWDKIVDVAPLGLYVSCPYMDADQERFGYVYMNLNGTGSVYGYPAPLPPAAPADLAASGGTGQIALSWTTVADAYTYVVKRADSAGGPYATVAAGLAGTTFTDAGLAEGTTYYYVVTAVNENGEGASSAEVSATTALLLPDAPTNLTAGKVKPQKVDLSWTPSTSTGVVATRVYRTQIPCGQPVLVAELPPCATSYSDKGVSKRRLYVYHVTAVNGAGRESAFSNPVTARTK